MICVIENMVSFGTVRTSLLSSLSNPCLIFFHHRCDTLSDSLWLDCLQLPLADSAQANANSNLIGTTFHDLSCIISFVTDKSRVRICLDTCHLFAAGYDIRTPAAYAEAMRKFDDEVGNGYLGGMHLNDSKADLGACKDLHENIGLWALYWSYKWETDS